MSCICLLHSEKVKFDSPIRIDEVCTHCFDDVDVMKDGKLNTSILIKWKVIQEIFLKVDDNMKPHTKEQLRKVTNLETTYLKRPSQPEKQRVLLRRSN